MKKHRTLISNTGLGASLGALGIVFGDIGTSPLYMMKAVFASGSIPLTTNNIMGITSCTIWMLIILVTGKYVLLVLRADNKGEGGIIALATLVQSLLKNRSKAWMAASLAGIFGAALFFGDSIITPAISVLSAVEGLTVSAPQLGNLVVPIALILLTGLFTLQRFGTSVVGKTFGPIMLLWFLSFLGLGLPHILAHPDVIIALSPHVAALFILHHPIATFIALGAIVLALTGAEALYADIAHFGRLPISRAWFAIVLPCLIVVYLGQAALLIQHHRAISNPFFLLAPSWAHVPLLVGAALATLIASQAVISGAYSVAVQCSRLNLFPHVKVFHTSDHLQGQVYLPGVNSLLYVAVAAIVLIFQSSEKLSGAYGVAVSTDFLLTTSLLLSVTSKKWGWKKYCTLALGIVLCSIELPLWAANIVKISSGGWLPLLIATLLFFLMLTWHAGVRVVEAKRTVLETSLLDYVEHLSKNPPKRIPGTAIYFHSLQSTVPLMLKKNVSMHRTLHDRVLIVSMRTMQTPHTDPATRAEIVHIHKDVPGVYHVLMRYGYRDQRNPLKDLADANISTVRTWDFAHAAIFTSHMIIEEDQSVKINPLQRLRRKIFVLLTRVSASPNWLQYIPREQQIEGGFRLKI